MAFNTEIYNAAGIKYDLRAFCILQSDVNSNFQNKMNDLKVFLTVTCCVVCSVQNVTHSTDAMSSLLAVANAYVGTSETTAVRCMTNTNVTL